MMRAGSLGVDAPPGTGRSGALAATERIRLLKFVSVFAVGGTERQVVTMAEGLDRARFELHLACFRRNGELLKQLTVAPPRVVEYHIRNLYDERSVRERFRFAAYIRHSRIQIVHTYGFYANVFAIPAAKLGRVPVTVASIRDTGAYLTPMKRRVQRVICRLADCIVANAEAVKRWLVDEGYDERRIAVIHNGIDAAPFGKKAADGKLHQELGLPPGAPLIAVLCRLSPIKGLEYFLEAAATLAAGVPEARFLIVGEADPQDAEYRRRLEAYADRLGLGRRVVFTGLRLDVPEVLDAVAVSVLPSLSEGLSNVLLESMAAGVPVVATRVGGNPEAVEEGVTGLLVPPRDAAALASAIARVLEDRELATRLGRAGRARVVERFSIRDAIRHTEQLYLTLLRRRGHGLES
jgi:glycosyltransferase involved in cell wall biosynthesis